MARRRQDVHLVIAGPDNEGWGARVRTWLGEEGVLSRTTFTGMLLGPDKFAVLRDASMFVLPSYSENFGLAVIEAMAAGLPVIISDKVNIWREVHAGGAGRVIPCDAIGAGRPDPEPPGRPRRRRRHGPEGQGPG